MKVCHMTSAHMPEDTRIFHKECMSLAAMGYEVYLIEKGNTYEKMAYISSELAILAKVGMSVSQKQRN